MSLSLISHTRYELADFWGNFVNSGNPNKPISVAPTWSPFASSGNLTAVFLVGNPTPESEMMPNIQEGTCDFWDHLGYQW